MRKILLAFLLLGNLLPAMTAGELLQSVRDNRAQIRSYRSETVTTVESPLAGRRSQNGVSYYQYPDALRTDSFNPRQTVLSVSGKTYTLAAGHIEETQNEKMLAESFRKPENLLDKFDLRSEPYEQGWRLTGTPRSANPDDFFSSIYFSRVLLVLDSRKNITDITLYDSLAKEILNVKTIYEEIDDLSFPSRTEVFLSQAKLKAITEHKQIQLNIPLDAALFDPLQIDAGE